MGRLPRAGSSRLSTGCCTRSTSKTSSQEAGWTANGLGPRCFVELTRNPENLHLRQVFRNLVILGSRGEVQHLAQRHHCPVGISHELNLLLEQLQVIGVRLSLCAWGLRAFLIRFKVSIAWSMSAWLSAPLRRTLALIHSSRIRMGTALA